jgi:glycosyltransferase involved in cell wall biosynthesis
MRIACLADPDQDKGNSFYRAIGPMGALVMRGHEVRHLPADPRKLSLAAVRDVDVLHVYRRRDERTLRLVAEAKAHGAAVVWDDDDDAGSLPKGTAAYKRFGGMRWERQLAATRRIFARADLVTTPSPFLAERLRRYGATRVEVVENYVPQDFLHKPRAPGKEVTIGWIAGWEHGLDVERIPIAATLQRILEERPAVRVVTIGLGLGLRSDRYHSVRKILWRGLAESTATFDIAIAPLADLDFNRARSNVKLKEYAAGGAPWLASPVGPYLGLGERQGGRLVPDDRWYEELTRLIDKPRERKALAKQATKWVAGETMERNGDIWQAQFSAVSDRSRAPLP